jgi:hypothetical protein
VVDLFLKAESEMALPSALPKSISCVSRIQPKVSDTTTKRKLLRAARAYQCIMSFRYQSIKKYLDRMVNIFVSFGSKPEK